MIPVSESWKNAYKGILLPETFLEISIGIADPEARDLAVPTSDSEATFSNVSNVVGEVGAASPVRYATLEHNLWFLDGSRNILPSDAQYDTPGYVSADDTRGNVTLTMNGVRDHAIPGFIITWSSEHGEYPTAFTIEAKNGEDTVASISVTDNASNVTEVPLEIVNYDKVVINIHEWNYPDHRMRIDRIYFGHVYSFGKKDVVEYSYEHSGCLLSGELPKASIQFSLDNVDGKWNPKNPTGLGKYLSERQKVTVRYGMYVDSAIEWIPGGVFYLTEWRAPSNGLTASFAARDVFEFLINTEYTGAYVGDENKGTLDAIVVDALSLADLPADFAYSLHASLADTNGYKQADSSLKVAEVIQSCANAACCLVFQDRSGVLRIEPMNIVATDYSVMPELAYAHPEIELTKPLKAVHVSTKGNIATKLEVASYGEVQTVDNPIIHGSIDGLTDPIADMAMWTKNVLIERLLVSGEFRADPRLDLFDIITVQSRYGILAPVIITSIKYSFSGCFHASYSGRVVAGYPLLDSFVLDRDTIS